MPIPPAIRGSRIFQGPLPGGTGAEGWWKADGGCGFVSHDGITGDWWVVEASVTPTSSDGPTIITMTPYHYLVQLALDGVTSLTVGGGEHILAHNVTGVITFEDCG
jgi:hypothetical protein